MPWSMPRKQRTQPDSAAYAQLKEALQRLTGLVNSMQNSAGKDQHKLGAAIFGLVKKDTRR